MNESADPGVQSPPARPAAWTCPQLLCSFTVTVLLLVVALTLLAFPSMLAGISCELPDAARAQTLGALVSTSTLLFAMPRTAILAALR